MNVDFVKAYAGADSDTAEKFLEAIEAVAKKENVTILLETDGIYSSSSVLCEFLDRFKSDNVAACWNMYAT